MAGMVALVAGVACAQGGAAEGLSAATVEGYYLDPNRKYDAALIYLSTEAGLYEANEASAKRFGQRLYCQPDMLVLAPEQIDVMLHGVTDGHAVMQAADTATVMLISLERTFPCKR
jgi:hypothetical protein